MIIYKYPLDWHRVDGKGHVILDLPHGFRILKVDFQHSYITLWILVNDENPTERVGFKVVATGQEFKPDGYEYVGTCVNDFYVWHVWMNVSPLSKE